MTNEELTLYRYMVTFENRKNDLLTELVYAKTLRGAMQEACDIISKSIFNKDDDYICIDIKKDNGRNDIEIRLEECYATISRH